MDIFVYLDININKIQQFAKQLENTQMRKRLFKLIYK